MCQVSCVFVSAADVHVHCVLCLCVERLFDCFCLSAVDYKSQILPSLALLLMSRMRSYLHMNYDHHTCYACFPASPSLRESWL